jgi:hypothetical protein
MWRRGDDLLIETSASQQLSPKFDMVMPIIGFAEKFFVDENLLWKCLSNCYGVLA